VQARGRTKVATNLRVEPGRTEARLYQFGRGIPVEVVGRAAADWVQVSDEKEKFESRGDKEGGLVLVRGVARGRQRNDGTNGGNIPSTATVPGDGIAPVAGGLWHVSGAG